MSVRTDFSIPEAAVEQPQLQRPPMYRVVLLNDDFTPMDFVVDVLRRFFHKAEPEAIRIMLQVHQLGRGTCGIYARDVAETKVAQVTAFSRRHGHPLQCVMEKAHAE